MPGVDYDVAVVGAGTAGCYLAKRLRRSGLNVCVLDHSKNTKTDSGIVSKHFFDYVPDESLIKSRIKAMNLVSPKGNVVRMRSTKPFAFLLDRERMGSKARSGIKSLIQKERFLGCDVHRGWIDVKTDQGRHSCCILVGADGAMSSVRQAVGLDPPQFTWGMLKHVKELRGNISVHFNKRFSYDGFAWQIPQTGEVGLLSSVKPTEFFKTFLTSTTNAVSKQRSGKNSPTFGSPIPVSSCRSYSDRIILVGDAAGQVKPLTGGGIVWGLRCADIAANAITYAFDAGRFDSFFWKTEYEQKWQAAIGREQKKQLVLRDFYRVFSDEKVEKAFGIVKPHLERVNDFDYDSLSKLIGVLPKVSLAKELATSFFRLSR